MEFRKDINGLRAIAVIAVLIFHFYPTLLPSGFLGVDIFFVISGYVITLYFLKNQCENGIKLTINFYARRFLRLLPALLVCLLITSTAFVLLTTRPPSDVFITSWMAALGMSNISLFLQSNVYFALESSLNPFQQTWSLGVEEQFYLFFPLILIASGFFSKIQYRKTKTKGIMALIIMLSISSYLFFYSSNQTAVFYLLPFRFWEIGLGSLACLMFSSRVGKNNILSIATIIVIVVTLLIQDNQTPYINLTIVFATAVFLTSSCQNSILTNILSWKIVQYIGKISYSLYLWHWSVLVLGKWTIGTSNYAIILMLATSFLFASLSYHFVENKFRYIQTKDWQVYCYAALSVAITVLILSTILPSMSSRHNVSLASFLGIAPAQMWDESYIQCAGRKRTRIFDDPLQECLGGKKTKKRTIYLIGDSHATQLVFMVKDAVENTNFEYKFINLERDFPFNLFKSNIGTSATLDFILDNGRDGDFVMISFHRGELNPIRDAHISSSGEFVAYDKTKNFISSMDIYAKKFGDKNISILFSSDTPLMRVVQPSEACNLQIKLFGESICRIKKTTDINTRAQQDYAYSYLDKNHDNIVIFDPLEYIYKTNEIFDVVDDEGNYLMMDWHHISQYQSEQLASDFKNFIIKYMN